MRLSRHIEDSRMNSAPEQPILRLRDISRDPDALLTEQQASALLGITARALQKWRSKGSGPSFVRISSRCIRYRRRDIVDWAAERLKRSTSEP